MKRITLLILGTILSYPAFGREISGTVIDSSTGEVLIGATVYVKQLPKTGTTTGLDGTFKLSTDLKKPVLVCSYLGYQTRIVDNPHHTPLTIKMTESAAELSEVVVTASAANTESGARMIERNSMNVVNVMSARAMELSPDITVGNIIQKMSGVTTERNSSGEGQYAILRGMDKRYNFTLVNGVKIPSPDNKNRFVPLDLFPSEILDRIEIYKSMMPNLEGDGIGGAVNLVMKDAPSRRLLHTNVTTGYNALYFDRDFLSFNHNDIQRKSPNETKGTTGDYGVSGTDFTNTNLRIKSSRPLPDILAGVSYGDRFFNNRLGIIASVSYQNLNRGKNSDWYYRSAYMTNGVERREYSDNRQRLAIHGKIDYIFSPRHKLSWYNGWLAMTNEQTRQAQDDKIASVRMRWNRQNIFNSTLQGSHLLFSDRFRIDWKGVFSNATNLTPDNATVYIQGNHLATSKAAVRRWEHNSDRDWAGYIDFSYNYRIWDFSIGGMFRSKKRNSFFNEYTFDSATGNGHVQVFGQDWNNFDGILITPREFGNVGDPLNYDADEKVAAGYAMAKLNLLDWELIAGLRIENTNQGYSLKFPRNVDPMGRQKYTDYLPSIHIKRLLTGRMNLRLSYARAINRPSFFEIVPYSIINEEYKEKGNPYLKHTVADNIDLRWEFFPKPSEQFMAGFFYKHLQNPIEYGLINEGQDSYYMPMNMGNANNMGLEIDILKYFNKFGIKANYTFTHSRITTDKRTMQGNDIITVRQSRPLFGQAAHVANLSLLFKDTRNGWDAQLTGSFISRRLADVSNWYDNDIWENDYFRMEISAEKSFRCGVSIFLKATNLLNLPMIRYYHKGPHTDNLSDVERVGGNVVERKERYGQTMLIGIRFKL
jgi:hypothetical protein BACCOPRO_02905